MADAVNAFYQGEKITKLELLTAVSFLKNNHQFNLFTYDTNIKKFFPKEVNIINANEIMEESKMFVYEGRGDCVRGSISGFSDIFRYYILYKVGGWYVDMDVTCLQSFDTINQDIVIRPHNRTITVANIIKMPKNYAPLKKLIEATEAVVDKNNDDWIKPLVVFNNFIAENNLSDKIVSKDLFGDDSYYIIKSFLTGNYFISKKNIPSHAIHWCNTAFKTGNWSKEVVYDFNKPVGISAYNVLLKKYDLI